MKTIIILAVMVLNSQTGEVAYAPLLEAPSMNDCQTLVAHEKDKILNELNDVLGAKGIAMDLECLEIAVE